MRDLPAYEQVGKLALTYREAAATLGIGQRTIWQLVADGKLKAIRIGRSVRIPVAEIEAFLEHSQETQV